MRRPNPGLERYWTLHERLRSGRCVTCGFPRCSEHPQPMRGAPTMEERAGFNTAPWVPLTTCGALVGGSNT